MKRAFNRIQVDGHENLYEDSKEYITEVGNLNLKQLKEIPSEEIVKALLDLNSILLNVLTKLEVLISEKEMKLKKTKE